MLFFIREEGDYMGLSFYLGPSGSGKSVALQQEVVKRSLEEPKRTHLLIVPDQFTMQTQKDICVMHPAKGILNIDVLSFGRLAHRVFEETGVWDKILLDDTGKNLMIRRITQEKKESLQVMHKNLDQIGYIHEIKSCMSEFMQYGITDDDLEQWMEYAKGKDLLYHKLEDLRMIYEELRRVLAVEYTTSEEVYLTLKEAIPRSLFVKDCVVVLDGFTGFTPLQNLVIAELLRHAKEVIVSVTIDPRGMMYERMGEQNLFYLSQKTIGSLEQISEEVAGRLRDRTTDRILGNRPVIRYEKKEELAFLEENLFRYNTNRYEGAVERIQIYRCENLSMEVSRVCMEIIRLVREEGYRYSDMAVVSGNLPLYAHYVRRECAKYEIPYFLDATKGILLNPCMEYVKSALEVVLQGYSYECIFHYLRSGMVDFAREDIDELENYVIGRGVRGYAKWKEEWTCNQGAEEEVIARMERLNAMREAIVHSLRWIPTKKQSVETITRSLYGFLVESKVEEKLASYERYFEEQYDYARAKEYGQIYVQFMNVLEQFVALMAEEVITLQEYAQILYAGFEEIQIGIIPQNRDMVMVGDIERTRLQEVKTLFFVGVNDGIIPKATSSGGILSDMEREFLQQTQVEMAPTPRQQMYQQKFYLYQNMTKPTQSLQLSYAQVDGLGKSVRPAYLIATLCNLYENLKVNHVQVENRKQVVATKASGLEYMSTLLRDYIQGGGVFPSAVQEEEFYGLYQWFAKEHTESKQLEQLLDAAFYEYHRTDLTKEVSALLYGTILSNSVSRLEQYASCAYSHFLKYGLRLLEREEYTLEKVDIGTVFHGVLEAFAKRLETTSYTWFDFSEEVGNTLLQEAVEEYCNSYENGLFHSSARYTYAMKRIHRILGRTINTLQYQLQKGKFLPTEFELSFDRITELSEIDLSMNTKEKMQLRGRIDRVDLCEVENQLQVKVVDYKSSQHQFDLVALYHGLQLQLVVYLNAAVSYEKQKHPHKEIVPAAILYYHVNDPVIDTKGESLSQEQVQQLIKSKLQMKGIISSDASIVNNLDTSGTAKSDVIPVAFQRDGSFKSSSSILEADALQAVSRYVTEKVKTLGRNILEGDIQVNPYEMGTKSSCAYCAYRSICKYDPSIEGYHTRTLGTLTDEEALERIMEGTWDSIIQETNSK